ncbi:MAG: thiamine phosphate synthase [Planctomycetota bacterium]|jgi:thiamine-phosphate pyrophosphorylase
MPDSYDQTKIDHSQIVLRRMIDANANRVAEGLRTLEDVARFTGLSNLQSQYKSVRHALQESIDAIGIAGLVSARDAHGDVGRETKTPSEKDRSHGIASIVAAAGSRVEQGLRVIEESCKVFTPSVWPPIEKLRYRVYDLNAALQLACQRDLAFLRQAKLYVLVDCRLPVESFRERVRDISNAGVQLIQIRDKQADPIGILKYTQIALDTLDASKTRLLINDRVDIAATTQVAGVHVGQEDLSVHASRRLLQPWQYIGFSTHNLDQVRSAVELGVDYIGCGPTFPSSTKSFESFSGLEFLKGAAKWLQENAPELPAYAIGGIDAQKLGDVLRAGFSRVAVGACVWNAQNPANAAERLRELLEKGPAATN